MKDLDRILGIQFQGGISLMAGLEDHCPSYIGKFGHTPLLIPSWWICSPNFILFVKISFDFCHLLTQKSVSEVLLIYQNMIPNRFQMFELNSSVRSLHLNWAMLSVMGIYEQSHAWMSHEVNKRLVYGL